jgi:hypothetical protein
VLHSLLLVKIEDGGAEYFFKPFLQVAFVHRYFTAEFFNGNGIAYMLEQYFPCLVYPVSPAFIGKELTGKGISIPFFHEAFEAVQKQLVHFRVHEDIFQRAAVAVIQQSVKHKSFLITDREYLGKRGRMFECKHFIFPGAQFHIMHKLVQESGGEVKIEYIYCLHFTAAVHGRQFRTIAAAFFRAVFIPRGTEPEFEKIVSRPAAVIMIYQHAGIFRHPGMLRIMPADHVIDRARDILLFLVQYLQAGLYAILVCNFQYV